MTVWERWTQQPRGLWLRKAAFQIHLWIGLAIGLYVVVLSLTGSALVFRREMDRAFLPVRPAWDRSGATEVLSSDVLRDAAQRAYPDYQVLNVTDVSRRNPVVAVELRRGGEQIERVFNAYTGEDLGDPFPRGAQIVLWLARLHDDLLWEDRGWGRFLNGIGSMLLTLLCLTGAVVWWPGIRGWKRAMTVKRGLSWPRFNFDLHSAIGFWFFLFLAMWAVSGIYLSIPAPFLAFNDWWYGGQNFEISRPVDVFFEWLVRLHFGRWRSHTLKVIWVIIGLIPAIMFITGAVMWWNRVARPRTRRARESAAWGRAETRGGGADVEATLS